MSSVNIKENREDSRNLAGRVNGMQRKIGHIDELALKMSV